MDLVSLKSSVSRLQFRSTGLGTVLISKTYDEFSLQNFVDRHGLLAEKKPKKIVQKMGLWCFSLSSLKKSVSSRTEVDVPLPSPKGSFERGEGRIGGCNEALWKEWISRPVLSHAWTPMSGFGAAQMHMPFRL